jgi:hypothetical protein
MRMIWILCWTGFLAACAAHHAGKVRCDGKLRPINSPAAVAPPANAAAPKAHDGVP